MMGNMNNYRESSKSENQLLLNDVDGESSGDNEHEQ